MQKEFTSLGMMTGTSADGIDASVIISDGKSKLKILHNQFLNFEDKTSEEILNLKQELITKKILLIFYQFMTKNLVICWLEI